MKTIKLINTPATKHPHNTTAVPGENMLRIYRQSPEDINFQIWKGRSVTSISLTFAEAEETAKALLAEIPRKTSTTSGQ